LPQSIPAPAVLFIRTLGHGSMDRTAQHLAAHLDVPVLDAEPFQRSGDLFGVRPLSPTALRRAVRDRRFVRRLRAARLPVHFPNHHLARFGLALREPYVVTVHDVIRWSDADGESVHIHAPSRRDRRLLDRDRRAVRQAAGVVVVSRHTAACVTERLGVPPARVAVVHQGIDHASFRPGGDRMPGPPYILFVGSEHPRKNLAAVLQALALLKRDAVVGGLRLVKVGAAGGSEAPFRERTLRLVRTLGLERDVVFTERVADDELAAWYRGAACLLLPSRAEGFGLPPLEAMACGCPAIVGRAGALPEVAGPAALLVDPDDHVGLAEATRAVLTDPELSRRLRAQGIAHAAQFRWEEAARATTDAYRRFLADARPAAAAPGRPRRRGVLRPAGPSG
jgi:glycosyltransferase involved in cell wall biosynthesis